MQKLNQTMFYKVSFDIREIENEDVLWRLVLCVRDWLGRKARRDGYEITQKNADWGKLKSGGTIEASGAKVVLDSVFHVGKKGNYAWAVVCTEEQRAEGCAPRTWITEIGYMGRCFVEGTVSITVSYRDMPGFIGPLQPKPNPSVPGIVSLILQNDRLACTVDGYEARMEPTPFAADWAEPVFQIIADRKREVPVILLSPTYSNNFVVDPKELARQIGPNALVYYANSCAASFTLNSRLEPYGMKCPLGGLRVYAARPNFKSGNDGYRHRFLTYNDLTNGGPDYSLSLLRRALAEDTHFWESLIGKEDIRRMNQESKNERRLSESVKHAENATFDEVAELLCEMEAENAMLEIEIDELSSENKSLKASLHDSESLRQTYEALVREKISEDEGMLRMAISDMRTMPSTPLEVAELMVRTYPNRIDFSDRGWDSLETCPSSAATVWEALHDIAEILHPLLKEGGCDIKERFNSRSSRFELARGEGPKTRASMKYMGKRYDVYRGREIFIEPHISSKSGKAKDPKFLRFYYDWDSVTGRVIIGETRHMENSQTASLK